MLNQTIADYLIQLHLTQSVVSCLGGGATTPALVESKKSADPPDNTLPEEKKEN